jgi:hypothetical protein
MGKSTINYQRVVKKPSQAETFDLLRSSQLSALQDLAGTSQNFKLAAGDEPVTAGRYAGEAQCAVESYGEARGSTMLSLPS